VLPGGPVPAVLLPGVISPDGTMAAMVVDSPGSAATEVVRDLRTGRTQPAGVPVNLRTGWQSLAWSPDSRWLLVASHGITAINPVNMSETTFNMALPDVQEIVVRP